MFVYEETLVPKASFLWHDIEPWGCPVTGRLHHISYSFTACIFYLALASFPRKPKTASNHYLAPLVHQHVLPRSPAEVRNHCYGCLVRCIPTLLSWYYSCCCPLVSQHLSWSTVLCPLPGNPALCPSSSGIWWSRGHATPMTGLCTSCR